MNQRCYQLVFNAARGCLMAVAESACRVGRAAGAGGAVLAVALPMLATSAQAQIKVDPAAPGAQRPTVLAAPNGTPLVNIQTPSSAGVSRNTYQQFDVGARGAVLNNSRTNVQTQLGGWVQGNPWLAQGEARVIVNEVNSAQPSQLRGFVEVGGRRAEVVIANPAGIQLDGAGFINASRATLTTGTLIFNGGRLEGYRVQQGTVGFSGSGLNATQTDYTAVLARAIAVNAAVHAKKVQLVTGNNTIRADTLLPVGESAGGSAGEAVGGGAAPAFALDVSELGGMYAGQIRLVGTEAGVGVRQDGTLAASAGDIHIDHKGWLSAAGVTLAPQGHIDIQATAVSHMGLTDSAHTHIRTETLDNAGAARLYGDRVSISAHTLTNQQALVAGSPVAATIAARERLDIGAQHIVNREDALIFSAADLYLGGALDENRNAITDGSANAQSLSNWSATIESLGDMELAANLLRNTNEHFATELVVVDGPTRMLLIQPQGSTARVPASSLYTYTWSRAWGYRFDTTPDPVAWATPVLGLTPIPEVGEATCTDPLNDDACTRAPGADYPAHDPAWAFFGVGAPAAEPSKPQPPVFTAGTTEAQRDAALQAFAQAMQAYEVAWAAWGDRTEEQYLALDQRIVAYNQTFRARDITHWTEFSIDRTISQSQVTSSAPASLIAGGNMTLRGADLLNDKSRILAGQALTGDLGSLSNQEALGQHVVSDTGLARSSWTYTQRGGKLRTGSKHTYRDFSAWAPYRPVDQVTTLVLPVSEVKASAAQAQAQAASTAATLTTGPLFGVAPNETTGYLIETDPAFTNYRNWLSSDYMLQALSLDPATAQKRLGDGFYEQKLVREQVAALTGHRFLGNYTNDEAQYAALMNAGATFAQAHELRPGIALSAAQVAQLTSDMVWLVARTVTLPDGATTTVLAPQVYLAPRPGDLAATGLLHAEAASAIGSTMGSTISADRIQLALSGDLKNSGTVAGRRLLDLSAQNIDNTGLLQGDAVLLQAAEDIRVTGGTVAATQGMALSAGRDIALETTTQSGSSGSHAQAGGNTFSHQGIDRVAGLYVSGPAGVLLASAGNDIHLIAAQVHNRGSGATLLSAGGSVNLGTVEVGQSQDITWNATNYLRQSRSAEVGSQVSGGGAVGLQAGQDIQLRAAQVQAQGALDIRAMEGSVVVQAGQSTESLAEAHQNRSRGFLSSRTTTTRSSSQSTAAQASELGGQSIAVQGQNILSIGTRFESQGGELHIEGTDYTVLYATQDSHRSESHTSTRRSTLGITTGKTETTSNAQSTTAVRTELLSDQAVRIGVGELTELVGASVSAPQIDIVRSQNAAPDAAGQLHLGAAIEQEIASTHSSRTTLGLWQKLEGSGHERSSAQMTEITGSVRLDPSIRLSVELPREVNVNNPSPGSGSTPSLQAQVQQLASQNPGLAYLQPLLEHPNVQWSALELAQREWAYQQQGLTGAGAALVALAVAWATGGMGAGLLGTTTATATGTATTLGGTTLATTTAATATAAATATTFAAGAAINAGFSALTAQASISLINNGGDIGKTLKDLGSQDSLRNIVIAMTTATVGNAIAGQGARAVAAQTVTGCVAGEASGAGCKSGAKTAAVLSSAGEAYRAWVGYAANAGPGENRFGTKLDGSSTGNAGYVPVAETGPRFGQQQPADRGMNVIGFNNPGGWGSQGASLSRALNRIPFVNATAGLHDYIFNAQWLNQTVFNNLWTMPASAIVSIPAAVNHPMLYWATQIRLPSVSVPAPQSDLRVKGSESIEAVEIEGLR